jgi:molecular chaperone GrpE
MGYEQLSREQLIETVKELERQLEQQEAETETFKNAAKKIKADFENYRKKQDERKEEWKEEARKELAQDLISVMDNLERAIASANQDSSLLNGVDMVADQLYGALEKRGLQRIDAEGEEFDPRLHNAVDTRDHAEDNKILEMQRKGYMYGEEILRPADVIVGKNTDDN